MGEAFALLGRAIARTLLKWGLLAFSIACFVAALIVAATSVESTRPPTFGSQTEGD